MLFRKLALVAALCCTTSATSTKHYEEKLRNVPPARKRNLRSLQSHIRDEVNKPSNSNSVALSSSEGDDGSTPPQTKVGTKKVKRKPLDSIGSANEGDITSDGAIIHTSSLNESDGGSNIGNSKKRFVVVCDDADKCESEISESMKGVKVVQKMKNTPNVAVEMSADEADQMDNLLHVRRVEDDQYRGLLHIPESNRPIRDRRLQFGQYEDYGIDYVNARDVWETYKDIFGEDVAKGSRAKVCVIDTGIRETHNDLDDERIDGSDFEGLSWDNDFDGHGTHVAGIIGASDNGFGVVGIAPEVKLHIVRVFNRAGTFSSDLVDAMETCVNSGANVINMSLGGPGRSFLEEREIQSLANRGVLFVAASGNSGDDGNPVEYPAGYSSVMSVGAANDDKKVAGFSTWNDKVSLAAPGVEVASLGRSSDRAYTRLSGTSMASPNVAGVAGLLFSLFPNASVAQVREALEASAQGLGKCGNDKRYGHGHVDALAAANYLYTNGDSLPDVDCNNARVKIKLDNYGSETSWYIANPDGVPIAGGGPFEDSRSSTEIEIVSLPELSSGQCYTFVIEDSVGDGLCCEYGNGSYELRFNNVEVTSSTFNGGSQETVQFGCGSGDGPTPTPPTGPTPTPPVPTPTPPAPTPPAPTPTNPPPTNDDDVDDCPNDLVKVKLRLETDRWSKDENELYLYDINDEDNSNKWIWNYGTQSLDNSAVVEESSCLDPKECYYFEFYDDYRDGLYSEDSNGLKLTKTDGSVLFDIEPDERGPYRWGRLWYVFLGNCSGR